MIHIWQNTPTGYMPWSNLRPRLPFKEFSWSPTSISILCWGSRGIQLLHPDNSHNCPPSINEVEPHHELGGSVLVAYSADWAHIAMAQQHGGTIVVLDHLSGILQQVNNTNMQIQDIKIVGNTIFVVELHRFVGFSLEAGRVEYGAHNTGRVVVDEILAINVWAEHLTLSDDCSQIAFDSWGEIFLYDIGARKITRSLKYPGTFPTLWFSPDGRQLWFSTDGTQFGKCYYFMRLEASGDSNSGIITEGNPEDGQPLFNLSSPCGHYVGMGSQWVMDSGGSKLLWLPPAWRAGGLDRVKWNGHFLALLLRDNPEPIIIEFQP